MLYNYDFFNIYIKIFLKLFELFELFFYSLKTSELLFYKLKMEEEKTEGLDDKRDVSDDIRVIKGDINQIREELAEIRAAFYRMSGRMKLMHKDINEGLVACRQGFLRGQSERSHYLNLNNDSCV